MRETKLPKIIFIVGSASAGKTTLAKIIKKKLPFYNLISDLDELKRLLKLEGISSNKKRRIKPLVSGGFDIIDPNIWDEILITTAHRIDPRKFYIFEFARGIDQDYLRTLRLKKHQVYDHCFDIILSVLPEIDNKNMLIIHVFSEFKARLYRNEKRRQNNEDFVAKKVMQEIYSEDIFRFVPTIAENIGYLNLQNKILVFSIDNSKELLPQEIQKYLDNQTQAALKYYKIAHYKKKERGRIDMISTKDYSNILRICASQEAVRRAVLQNYNNNLWWPLSIKDWRIRLLIAGLSLRVSYGMIETFRKVVNELSSYTYEEISLMNRGKFKSIVRPIGLTKLRVRFFLSTLDFVNYVERNKLDIYRMSYDELINLLKDRVFGIGYHGAQCCTLYILGYHCGIMPVDSGMKRLLCPCIGLPAPNIPYGYEILRKQLENLTRSIDYNQIAVKEEYESLNLRESRQLTWWAHLVLIYYKRFFCNKGKPDLCPLKNTLATKEIIGQMCSKKHKEVGGVKNVVIEGIDEVSKTTLAEMFYRIGFKKFHAEYHRRIKNLYSFYKNFLERRLPTERFVLDRTFISEAVYGPVLRGKNRLSEMQFKSLLKKLKDQNTILVYLYAPLTVLLGRKNDQQHELQKYYSDLTKMYEFVIATVSKYIPVIKIDSNKNNPAQIFSQITGLGLVEKNK